MFNLFHPVANEQLRGTSLTDAALIQQFVDFADHEILPAAATWVFPTYGIMQYNKQVRKIYIVIISWKIMMLLTKEIEFAGVIYFVHECWTDVCGCGWENHIKKFKVSQKTHLQSICITFETHFK